MRLALPSNAWCHELATSSPAGGGLPVRRCRGRGAAQSSPASLQTRPEGLGSASSAAACSCQARRWLDPEASEAPVEVNRYQLSDIPRMMPLSLRKMVSLIERNTLVRGEVVSVRLHGARAHIQHGLPFVCLRRTLSVPRSEAALEIVPRLSRI